MGRKRKKPGWSKLGWARRRLEQAEAAAAILAERADESARIALPKAENERAHWREEVARLEAAGAPEYGPERRDELKETTMARKQARGDRQQETNAEVRRIPVTACAPTADNPRVVNEKSDKFADLVKSIRGQGVLIPIHVRPHPSEEMQNGFEILCGERRWRASAQAGCETIPALVHEGMTDEEAFELTFTENYCREDLTPLEEGRAVETLMQRFGGDVEAVAAKLGWSASAVRMRAKLKNLSDAWRERIADPEEEVSDFTAAHLDLVARMPAATQDDFYRCRWHNFSDWRKGLVSVADLRAMIDEYLHAIAGAPWADDDETLLPEAGPCTTCARRSDGEAQQGLWDEEEAGRASKAKGARCMDAVCWEKKTVEYLKRREAELKAKHDNLIIVQEQTLRGAVRDAYKKRAKDRHEYDRAKKSDPASVPAMMIGGNKPGRLAWVKKYSYYGGSTPSSSSRAQGAPTPLEERRAKLDAKRWAQVLLELREKVEFATIDSVTTGLIPGNIMAMAIVFGTDGHMNFHNSAEWKQFEELARNYCNTDTESLRALAAKLLNEIKPVLAYRLTYNGPLNRLSKSLINEARNAAFLLDIDLQALFDDVSTRKGFTEPKSWQNLNADGTPKTAKSEKPKKTAKKKASKKKTAKTKGKAKAAKEAD